MKLAPTIHCEPTGSRLLVNNFVLAHVCRVIDYKLDLFISNVFCSLAVRCTEVRRKRSAKFVYGKCLIVAFR